MKGLDLARAYYKEYGEPMLFSEFADVVDRIAVGLVGSGSECLGYDDEISRDHDFEPAFCIFLPDESVVDRRTAFLIERAYAKLPREFMGVKRSTMAAVGGDRHGVMRTADFYAAKTGRGDGVLSIGDWLTIPEQSILEAVNGEVFFDRYGEFSRIREGLCYLPEDIRLKKLAGNLLIMGQAGQYNYPRLIKRGEIAAAQLAAVEFAKSAMHAVFLINRRYMPYYKWSFRALRELPTLSSLAPSLERIIAGGPIPDREALIEGVCREIADAIARVGIKAVNGDSAEELAYRVNNCIENGEIRNLHVLAGV